MVVQYSETNVIHSLFSLLSIKGLYMFRALLAHPQESLHKRHVVYCVRVISVRCTTHLVQRTDIPTFRDNLSVTFSTVKNPEESR
jgi:hypothetical protein